MNLRRSARRLLALTLVSCLCAPSLAQGVSDDDVRLALVYKIARFVTWPVSSNHQAAPLRLCFANDEIFELAQKRLTGRSVKERPLRVLYVAEDIADVSTTCDILYMARTERDRVEELIKLVSNNPILTISDTPDFVNAGGMVGLSTRSKKVAIRINVAAYESSNLVVSSQLLELAELFDENRRARR